MCSRYSSYSEMYKMQMNSCLYTSKINIYTNPAFQPLPPLNICVFPIYPPSVQCCTSCTSSNTSCSTGSNTSCTSCK